MTQLLIPNFHVALIHFPIALVLAGVAVEVICSIAYRQSPARLAGRWMILLGAALSWPAFYSGIAAVGSIVGDDSGWNELRANSPVLSNPAAWEALRTHFLVNAGATLLTSLVVIVWLMAGERTRSRLRVPAVLLLLLACAAMVFGAWQGGELVYFHDVTGIARSPGQAATTKRAISLSPTSIAPPLDMHLTLAGVTTGLCLLAWGVSARSRRVEVPGDPSLQRSASDPAPATGVVDPQRDRIFAAFQPATIETVAEPPPSTLGTLASLSGVATAFFGLWVLSQAFDSRSPRVLFHAILDADNGPVSRRLAHLIAGLCVIALPLLLGWAGSRSRSSRAVPLVIGTVMLVAVVAQSWIGVLLLFDANSGSVFRVNP